MPAVYPSGTIRARRWRGDEDIRGYRPPYSWTACAELTDIHPITGRALPHSAWWRRRNNRHISAAPKSFALGAVNPKSGRGSGRDR